MCFWCWQRKIALHPPQNGIDCNCTTFVTGTLSVRRQVSWHLQSKPDRKTRKREKTRSSGGPVFRHMRCEGDTQLEWNGCRHCETTDWVPIVNKYAGNLSGCMCKEIRHSRDGDVYFDMTDTFKNNRRSKKDRNNKACCMQ